MDDIQRLIIERACESLVIDYAVHLDHKRPDAFAGLFTDDAHFKHPRLQDAIIGSAKIRQWLAAYAPDILIRHVTANIRVHVVDADHATGTSYTTAYRLAGHNGKLPAPQPGPYCIVEYEDRYRRTRDGWKIAHRSSQYIFRAE
jgi:hypothetical protein